MNEKDLQHQTDLERIEKFRLFDDDFMNTCFDGDIAAVELILRIILDKPDLKVSRVETQKLIKSLSGRDIWLDINATSDGVEYNVEIQRADKGAEPERARVHSSMIDSHALAPGSDFDELPDCYVIFITENDVLGGSLPIYHVDRTIAEMNHKSFGDREHIIYVNGADRNVNTELGRLMHDFSCTKADDMNYKELSDNVRYFKENEEGVKTMCKIMEDMREETAKAQDEKTKVIDIKNLMETMKWSVEQAMDAIKIPPEQRSMYAGLVNQK